MRQGCGPQERYSYEILVAIRRGGSVTAAGVVDERAVSDGYPFGQISDAQLPFGDGQLDVFVSNHVIEHVGPRPAQLTYLTEIRRVLRTDGMLYLAAPNRWILVEPHFRLPALSWLPRELADRYVRAAGRGSRYDCGPCRPRGLRRLFMESGSEIRNLCPSAVRLEIAKHGGAIARILGATPDAVLHRLGLLMPSLIFLATPKVAAAPAR